MKKSKFLSILMLILMTMPSMVACGGDDDDIGNSSSNGGSGNDGTAAAYTEDEVMDILKGEWEVYGSISETYNNQEYQKYNFSGEYKGKIKFEPKYKKYVFTILEGDKYDPESSGNPYYPENFYIRKNYNDQEYFSLLKKEGKYYIAFDYYRYQYYFEIQSLTKTSFRMLLDKDFEGTDTQTKEKITGHVRMSLISK